VHGAGPFITDVRAIDRDADVRCDVLTDYSTCVVTAVRSGEVDGRAPGWRRGAPHRDAIMVTS
jgi:hypothetical protein